MTVRDRFVAALDALGEQRVKETHRFVVYTRTRNTAGGLVSSQQFYYVGRVGALRIGATLATSLPVSAAGRERLLGAT